MSLTSALLRVQHKVYVATDGRVGHRMIGVPTLMLYTKGRKSGQTRNNSLVYARDGDDYVLVPSNGGADKAPGWLFNVEADPSVEVQVKRDRSPGTARVVRRGEPDFERLWKIVNENNHDRYDAYQRQTERQIPLVVVTPGSPAARA
jgi:deazaflavin-dependent oxidoreductase (nitroreductase family)